MDHVLSVSTFAFLYAHRHIRPVIKVGGMFFSVWRLINAKKVLKTYLL